MCRSTGKVTKYLNYSGEIHLDRPETVKLTLIHDYIHLDRPETVDFDP